jgi:DNA-binding NtrC family response regulator
MKGPSAIAPTYPDPSTNPTATLTILSVSPADVDHSSLEAIIADSPCVLMKAHDLVSALSLLQRHDIAVVVCERDLGLGRYVDVLEHLRALPHAPSLIVACKLADEHLWAEALNLGAYDVLAKPFDAAEVTRTLSLAWVHWCIHNDAAPWPARFKAAGA